MANGSIYIFKPIHSDTASDLDTLEWKYEKREDLPPYIETPEKANRYVTFRYLGIFYVDLRYVDVTKFEGHEIPRELVKKVSREVKLDYILKK